MDGWMDGCFYLNNVEPSVTYKNYLTNQLVPLKHFWLTKT